MASYKTRDTFQRLLSAMKPAFSAITEICNVARPQQGTCRATSVYCSIAAFDFVIVSTLKPHVLKMKETYRTGSGQLCPQLWWLRPGGDVLQGSTCQSYSALPMCRKCNPQDVTEGTSHWQQPRGLLAIYWWATRVTHPKQVDQHQRLSQRFRCWQHLFAAGGAL